MRSLSVLLLAPPRGAAASASLPSTGSSASEFPGFPGTMKACDFLGPSRRASLSCAWRYHPVRLSSSLPRGPTPAGGLELWAWQLRANGYGLEIRRTSQVPGEPWCVYALFSDPGGISTTRPYGGLTRPPTWQNRGLPAGEAISGLHSTASALAVYASRRTLLAATPDSLPAAGQALRDGIGYP